MRGLHFHLHGAKSLPATHPAGQSLIDDEETSTVASESYLREHSAGSIIRTAFKIYWRHLGFFVLASLLPGAPLAILDILFVGMFGDHIIATKIASNVVPIIAGYLAIPLATLGVSDVCLGRRPQLRQALKRTLQSAGVLFATIVLIFMLVMLMFTGSTATLLVSRSDWSLSGPATLAVVVSAFAVSICAVIAVLWLSFTLPAVMIEDQPSPLRAMKRSIQLMRHSFWRNNGILLLANMLMQIIMLCLVVILTALSVFAMIRLDAPIGSRIIVQILMNHLILIFLTPMSLIPIVLLYYDMRVRKEGFDKPALATEMMS